MNLRNILPASIACLLIIAETAWGQTEHREFSGTAVFGVDVFGRWIIGLDSDDDQLLDRYWRYTGEQYADGPWFETRQVHIEQLTADNKLSRVRLSSDDSQFSIELWHDRAALAEAGLTEAGELGLKTIEVLFCAEN